MVPCSSKPPISRAEALLPDLVYRHTQEYKNQVKLDLHVYWRDTNGNKSHLNIGQQNEKTRAWRHLQVDYQSPRRVECHYHCQEQTQQYWRWQPIWRIHTQMDVNRGTTVVTTRILMTIPTTQICTLTWQKKKVISSMGLTTKVGLSGSQGQPSTLRWLWAQKNDLDSSQTVLFKTTWIIFKRNACHKKKKIFLNETSWYLFNFIQIYFLNVYWQFSGLVSQVIIMFL